jgi:CheY-like chemotaxis protein
MYRGTATMVVDDSRETHEVLCQIQNLRGYVTAEIASGEAALAYFNAGKTAQLIILDRALPDMSGDEVRAALARDPATAHSPVIVFSALRNDGAIADVVAYVRKAMHPDRLLRLVDQECQRSS